MGFITISISKLFSKGNKGILLWLLVFIINVPQTIAVNGESNFKALWEKKSLTANKDTIFLKSLLELGDLYLDNSPDSALYYYDKVILFSKELGINKSQGFSLHGIGKININRGNFKEAEKHFIKSLEIFKKLNNERGIIITYNHLGYVSWKTGNFKEGLKIYLGALKSAEEINDSEIVGQICNDIGLIYWEQKDFNKSLDFFHRSLAIRKERNDKKGLCQAYNNIGLINGEIKDELKALQSFLKGYKIAQEINYLLALTIIGNNLGLTYGKLGEFKLANQYYDQAMELAIKNDLKDTKVLICESRSATFLKQKKYLKSIEFGLKGIELSKEVKALSYLKNIYDNLSAANDSLGNYKDAYKYHKLFKTLNDSLFNESNSKQIIEMQTKYDTEKKERENELLRKGNELQQLTIKKEANFRNFLIVITILILLLAGLLYNKVRSKKQNEIVLEQKVKIRTEELEKAKERAEENDRLKSAFLANISHEIRTPMNGIMGFAELLKKPQLEGNKQKEFINKIEKSGERMLTIINNLVDISKVESNQMEIVYSSVNIKDEMEDVFNNFRREAFEKGLEFSFVNLLSKEEPIIKTDQNKLNTILTNLLKNSLKFTLNGSVNIGYKVKEEFLEFYVRDTGIGITEDMKGIIFERFIQADLEVEKQYDGAGLGLSISKAFVEMLGGKIWVESEYWMGSTFYFTLPLKKVKEIQQVVLKNVG